MIGKLLARRAAGRHGYDVHSVTPRAFNVTRRITDDDPMLGLEPVTGQLLDALKGKRGERVSVRTVRSESTTGEPIGQAVRFEVELIGVL